MRSSLPYSSRALARGCWRDPAKLCDEECSRDVAKLERSADPDQVVPVLGDLVDLGVVAEQGPAWGHCW